MAPAPNPAAVLLTERSWCAPRSASAVFRFWAFLVPQVVVAPVLAFGITFLHELAHAAAVLAVGGPRFAALPD